MTNFTLNIFTNFSFASRCKKKEYCYVVRLSKL